MKDGEPAQLPGIGGLAQRGSIFRFEMDRDADPLKFSNSIVNILFVINSLSLLTLCRRVVTLD
jgi:hypothetical protein